MSRDLQPIDELRLAIVKVVDLLDEHNDGKWQLDILIDQIVEDVDHLKAKLALITPATILVDLTDVRPLETILRSRSVDARLDASRRHALRVLATCEAIEARR